MSVKVKICGITRPEDARVADEEGADFIGIIFAPESSRCVRVDVGGNIASVVSDARIVGVFVDQPPEEINRIVDEVGLDFVQLHGAEGQSFIDDLSVPAIKALPMDRTHHADDPGVKGWEYVLCDTRAAGQFGGTGQVFDWDLARDLAAANGPKVIVSGGLTPLNVADAVRAIHPWGVDASSGLEYEPGYKDHKHIADFIKNAKAAG